MIQRAAVIGGGTMGHSFANNFASHGIEVRLYEPFDEVRNTVIDRIRTELEIMVEENYFPAEKIQETLSRITLFKDLEPAVRDCDLILEALPEDLELKQDLFAQLDRLCPPEVLIASNTSSLKLADLTAHLPDARKAKVLITHGYNPPHLIPIIELSFYGNMSQEDYEQVEEFFVRCEKVPVKVLKDVTGMVANRLLHAQAREAFYLIDQGIASAEDVDRAIMAGPCFRNATTGMLECADMGGLDIWCAAEHNFFPDLADNKKPSETMQRLVDQGDFGIKTGKGFYRYPEETRAAALDAFNRRLIRQLAVSRSYWKKEKERLEESRA